jgi:hypothetical protein
MSKEFFADWWIIGPDEEEGKGIQKWVRLISYKPEQGNDEDEMI